MKDKKSMLLILAIIGAVFLLAIVLFKPDAPEVVDYGTLINKINNDEIAGLICSDNYTVKILYKGDENVTLEDFKKGKKQSAISIVTDRTSFSIAVTDIYAEKAKAAQQGEEPEMPYLELNNPEKGSILRNIVPILTFVMMGILAVFLFMTMRGTRGGNSALNFGKTKANMATNVKVKFNDVAGAEEEKEELKEIVDFLKNPKKFSAVGAKIPHGVLLVGLPGTGKTLFAKAIAGEANVPFFSISGSDFVEMFVGVGASRVRDLFAQAKKNMPCIVFIDEIDAVGRQRGAGIGGGNDEREQTLNQLLVQMDGFESNEGIIIIAATNRADVLDPALLRPGRFDRQIYVHIPDVKGREAIFKVHARNKPIAPDVDFKNLARLTSGFSGADIENLLNESAILAARAGRKVIIMKDLLEGVNKVIAGPQKKSRIITEADKRITAYHEAGHAIVGALLPNCDEVQEVSIIPRGMAAGYTISIPRNDDAHITKSKLNDELAMLLGGRAAEELIIKDISTGASADIKRASLLARKMVCEWGMSESLPNMYFGGDQEVFIGRDYQTQLNYGEEVAGIIDKEAKAIIDHNYKRAVEILSGKLDVMENMVRLLFERETIYTDEVHMLLEGKSLAEINDYIDRKRKEEKEEARQASSPFGSAEGIILKGKEQPDVQNQLLAENEKDLRKEEREESQEEEKQEKDIPEEKDSKE
ncbi:MAG: ATP-dependent zinc metalloprotease FtsH [Christensenellales bacterium]|jgi:cell division protease FtsH